MMSVARGEVERYAPGDEKLLSELNGYGKLEITIDPPEADAYLFSFETIHGFDKNGNHLAERSAAWKLPAAAERAQCPGARGDARSR
jgi:hypothetical protein